MSSGPQDNRDRQPYEAFSLRKRMFEILVAKTEDKEAVQRIYTSVAGHRAVDDDEARWDRLIRAGGLLVAQEEDRVIGFGGIDVHAAEQVKWLYLLPQYQGLGLGSEILKRLEDIGWDAGLDTLRLHSAIDAEVFYRRHGYHSVPASDQIGHDHEGVEMVKERHSTD
ncbi:MAG: GNAT family N-acetyltransferase [Pyrinomonadaceae bacterium]